MTGRSPIGKGLSVRFRTDDEGRLVGFRAEGHTGFDLKGKDLVCAAVSALVNTAVLSLDRIAGMKVSLEEGDGLLECRLEGEPTETSETILRSLEVGLAKIEEQYAQYIVVTEETHGA